MTVLFLFSLFALVYVYILYPALIFLASRFYPMQPRHEDTYQPIVTIVIPAYNEVAFIAETVRNKLAQDYPVSRLNVVVVSDCSTDGTDEAVLAIGDPRVSMIRQEERLGKTAALNAVVPIARGEIVVLSDANSIYAPDAVRNLVRHFHSPDVGYVTGRMIYKSPEEGMVSTGGSAYLDYESWIHVFESRMGSVIGCDGGIDAIRKELWPCVPHDLISDFVVPLKVLEKGKKVLFDEKAVSVELSLQEPRDELRMRTRVIVRAFRGIWYMRSLINPFRYPRVAFQILSHKVFRYYAPVFLLALLLSTAYLSFSEGWIYPAFFFSQLGGYILGAFNAFKKDRGGALVGRLAGYFFLVNYASLLGIIKFHAGEKFVIWSPRIS